MQLIQNKDFLLLIDEEAEIKKNDLCLIDHNVGTSIGYEILVCEEVEEGYYHFADFKTGRCSKITAYYPLTKEAKELDLPLLPNPFEKDIKLGEDIVNYCSQYKGTEKYTVAMLAIEFGYNLNEDKQFTLEDVVDFVEWTNLHYRDLEHTKAIKNVKDTKELFNYYLSLSTQQLPKEFIPKYSGGRREKVMGAYITIPKELQRMTNSEGKQELLGTYKY